MQSNTVQGLHEKNKPFSVVKFILRGMMSMIYTVITLMDPSMGPVVSEAPIAYIILMLTIPFSNNSTYRNTYAYLCTK